VPPTTFSLLWADRPAVPPGDDWLSPAEQAESRAFRHERRRGDFHLRRWTARLALRAAGFTGLVEIRRDDQGAPACVAGGVPVSLSLSDRQGRAICLLGPTGAPLGCDIEWVEPRSPAFIEQFLSPDEARRIDRAPEPDRPLLANLAWSAKESALKALGVGLRRDTRTVVVHWSPPLPTWGRLKATVPGEAAYDGWWRIDSGWVLTALAEHMPEPPCVLSEMRGPGRDWTQSD